MTGKEYLYRLKNLSKIRRALADQVLLSRSRGENIASQIKEIMVRNSPAQDKIENAAIGNLEVIELCEKRLRELDEMESVATRMILEIENLDYQTILLKYYHQDESLEQVAVDMNYTYRWVSDLHSKALQEFDRIAKKNNVL